MSEFYIATDATSLQVHVFPPHDEGTPSLATPVRVMSLKSTKQPTEEPLELIPTSIGLAVLLDNKCAPDMHIVNHEVAAEAVLEFFMKASETDFDMPDENLQYIPRNFLEMMPQPILRAVERTLDPPAHTGFYL